jgi:hypothetical protein
MKHRSGSSIGPGTRQTLPAFLSLPKREKAGMRGGFRSRPSHCQWRAAA